MGDREEGLGEEEGIWEAMGEEGGEGPSVSEGVDRTRRHSGEWSWQGNVSSKDWIKSRVYST